MAGSGGGVERVTLILARGIPMPVTPECNESPPGHSAPLCRLCRWQPRMSASTLPLRVAGARW